MADGRMEAFIMSPLFVCFCFFLFVFFFVFFLYLLFVFCFFLFLFFLFLFFLFFIKKIVEIIMKLRDRDVIYKIPE